MPENINPQQSANKPAHKISRRGFLRIAASLGIAGFTGSLFLKDQALGKKVQQTRLIMGTIANLTLIVPGWQSVETAKRAIDACFSRMTELEAVLSRFQPSSQVSILNREGSLREPHPALHELVRQSIQIAEASKGAFDITILPVLALYQAYQALDQGLPPDIEIEKSRHKVGFHHLQVSDGLISFAQPGMGITLDGIAKGFIVEEGLEQLRQFGFTDALVEAGGDLVASGWRSAETPWQIGIQQARPGGEAYAARFSLHDQAAATSGDYYQPFSPDFAQHHILNPLTGRSSPALASATVIASNLTLADALATALMVMEPQAGQSLANSLGCETYLIPKVLTKS